MHVLPSAVLNLNSLFITNKLVFFLQPMWQRQDHEFTSLFSLQGHSGR